MFTGIPHTELDSVWQEVLPWIESACRRTNGRYLASDIYRSLQLRETQLWAYRNGGIEAVCVTEIIKYPRKKYCRILIGTGRNRQNWQHHVLDIEQWAWAQECDGMESFARIGWWRAFYRTLTGWKFTHEYIEKEF